jgi:hypothetical protein
MMMSIEDAINDAMKAGMQKSFEECEKELLGKADEKSLKILEDLRLDNAARKERPPHYFSYRRFVVERFYEHTK